MITRKPADKVGLMLRFSEALRRRLAKAADIHNRSLNSEIVARLEASFRHEDAQADREELAKRAAAEAAYQTAVAIAKQIGGGPIEQTWGRDKEGRLTWSVEVLPKPTEGEKK